MSQNGILDDSKVDDAVNQILRISNVPISSSCWNDMAGKYNGSFLAIQVPYLINVPWQSDQSYMVQVYHDHGAPNSMF